jgi:hypothetical protein
MGIVEGIIALLKAIPILDRAFRDLVSAYNKWKIESHDKAFTEGLKTLISQHDQRELEKAAGLDSGPEADRTDVITRPRSH